VATVVPVSPSITLTSLIVSVDGGSSSVIVPMPCPSAIVAFDGFERLTKKVSLASSSVSPLTRTVTVSVVWPAAKVSVPLAAV
jgi:hypothetical protein